MDSDEISFNMIMFKSHNKLMLEISISLLNVHLKTKAGLRQVLQTELLKQEVSYFSSH